MVKKTDKEKLLEIFRKAGIWIPVDDSNYFELVSDETVGFCFDKNGNLFILCEGVSLFIGLRG